MEDSISDFCISGNNLGVFLAGEAIHAHTLNISTSQPFSVTSFLIYE